MSYLFRRAILTVIVAVIVGYFGDHAIHQPHAEHPPKLSAILVTGASSGIGRAAAFALFEHGFVVYAGVRDTSALEELKTHGTRMRPLLLDVSKQQHIDDAFATITAAAQVAGGGQLVGIVNNAGTTYKRPLETADLDSVRALFDVNVLGVLAVTQRFLPLLRRARGRIVNIGSVQGVRSHHAHGTFVARP